MADSVTLLGVIQAVILSGMGGGGMDPESWFRSRATGEVQFQGGPPDAPFPNGTSFSATLTDNAVLQRGAGVHAAVYGVVQDPSASTGTTVTITYVDHSVPGAQPTTGPATIMSVFKGVNVTWKALLPPHPAPGGNLSLSAVCGGQCSNTTETSIHDLTYGDVWICSGQSNMELPMAHALTRNRTYAALDERAQYSNIRTFARYKHVQVPDGQEIYVLPPQQPASWDKRTGLPNVYNGWTRPNSSSVDSFSAACWFFAQELTDIALTANKTAPIIGIIQSAWGGTKIEDWVVNSSIPGCKNASGGVIFRKPGYGSINNGMIAPFVNYTIFGALWYQGENNVGDCLPSPTHEKGVGDAGLASCGNSLDATGYACLQRTLVTTWRKQWSATPNTTSPMFPLGIVSLAAGTSEGNSQNMPNFRLAQTASFGFLPGPTGSGMESTFIAQGYDAGDPGFRQPKPFILSEVDSPFQENYDAPYPGRVGYSAGGYQSFTKQFMGGLHPRPKQTIGRRLALAAQAVAYGDTSVPFTGPVLKGCTVYPENTQCVYGQPCKKNAWQSRQRQITINFDEALLRDDAVKVWPTAPDTEGLTITALYSCLNATCLEVCGANQTCVWGCAHLKTPPCTGFAGIPIPNNGANGVAPHMHYLTGRSVSPLEVQFNGALWMPASLSYGAQPRTAVDGNGTRMPGWSSVITTVPTGLPLGCSIGCPPPERIHPDQYCVNCTHTLKITGVRYAWSESPCCGGNLGTSMIIPCPVNSCPISTYNSTLPAVPFSATIVMSNNTDAGVGTCACAPPQVC